MHNNAKLLTRDGQLVREFVMLPQFQLLPELCVWGTRFFVLEKPFEQTFGKPAEAIYKEVCPWSVDASDALMSVARAHQPGSTQTIYVNGVAFKVREDAQSGPITSTEIAALAGFGPEDDLVITAQIGKDRLIIQPDEGVNIVNGSVFSARLKLTPENFTKMESAPLLEINVKNVHINGVTINVTSSTHALSYDDICLLAKVDPKSLPKIQWQNQDEEGIHDLPPGKKVSSVQGGEKISVSRHITVNGKDVYTIAERLTYSQACVWAGYQPDRILSITWHRKTAEGDEGGILSSDNLLELRGGERISVADTSNA